MGKRKLSQDAIKYIYLTISIAGWILFACSLILSCINLWFIALAVVFLVVFVVFYKFARAIYLGFQIKYIWLGKDYKTQVKNALEKFGTTDEDFIQTFKKDSKNKYKRTGSVFGNPPYCAWVYRSDENIPILKKFFTILYECVESKGGFNEFFDRIKEVECNQDEGYRYNAYAYLRLDIVSPELDYLISVVYNETNFYNHHNDIGLSENFLKENLEQDKRVDEVYSPMLFRFADEVKMLYEKISKLKEIEKLKKEVDEFVEDINKKIAKINKK